MTGNDPTQISHQRLCAAEPMLSAISPLREFKAIPERTLFHAGPPLTNPNAPPPPLRNGALAAIVLEGWAGSRDEADALLINGDIRLVPAQDTGIVTPLAYVVGPSTICLKVIDQRQPDHFILAPLNDGPPPHAIRFGVYRDEGLAIARLLIDGIGGELSDALIAPLPLLPAMAVALANGDELHARVTVMQEQVRAAFQTPLSSHATTYFNSAGQFALNVVMAAAALMIGSGGGVPDSQMVVACGGNGENLGYKLANAPANWVTLPATRPVGTRLPGHERAAALPAIGDSAVIDALGLGAACLRFSPEIAQSLQGHFDRQEISPAFLKIQSHQPFLAPHPAFANEGLCVGLDLARPRDCLGINLGIVEATGQHGLIGRGVAPWPSG